MAIELTSLQKVNPLDLIGRTKDLENLRKRLADQQRVVVVNGIGGIGKTTLAEAYVFQYHKDYEHIIWITHEADKISDDFLQNQDLLRNLKLDINSIPPQQIYGEIMNCLRNLSPTPNLLIIDNTVPSIEPFLKDFPTPPNWHLLLTSREKIAGVSQMNLSYLNPTEAKALFKKHCLSIRDEGFIEGLTASVEYHTLAIELLAKTAQVQMLTPEQLINAIPSNVEADIKTKHSDQEKIERITSYLVSIFDLSELSPEEIWMLKQFTCLPFEFHYFEKLKEIINPDGDKLKVFAKILTSLAKKGWLLRDEKYNRFRMHRIIQTVVLERENIGVKDIQSLLDFINGKLYLDQTKDNPVDKFPWIPFGSAIEDVFKNSEEEDIANLQNYLAFAFKYLGDYEEAKLLMEKAVKSFEKNFGQDHYNTSVSYSYLGIVLKDLGDYEGARILLEKAVKSFEKRYGQDHDETATSYSNLATVLKGLGDYEGAKTLMEKAVKSSEKTFGESHPRTALNYSNLATVLKGLGDYEGAKTLLEKAVKSAKKTFGEFHPTTAGRYSNLATVLKDLGDYEGAKTLLEKAAKSDEKTFGESHPTTAGRYWNMGALLLETKELEQALIYTSKANVIYKNTFPDNHPYISGTEYYLEKIKTAIEASKS